MAVENSRQTPAQDAARSIQRSAPPNPATAARQDRGDAERFRLLFEQAVDGIFVSDAQGHYLDVNEAGCRMLGYSEQEILSRTIEDVIAPGERQRIAPHIEQFASGKITRSDWQFVRKDGSSFVGEVVARQLPDGRLQAILRDVSRRKRVEEALQKEKDRLLTLLHSIPDEVWVANAEGRIEMINPAAAAEFGKDRAVGEIQEVARKTEAYRPDGTARPPQEAPLLCALRGQAVQCQEEILRSPVRGELRHRQVSASPFRDTSGNIVGAVAVVRDITDLKRAEQARAETEERLRTVLQASGVGLWMHNLSSSRLEWDARTCELFFVKPGEEPTMELFWSRVHPEDRRLVREEADRALREGVMYRMDHRAIDPATGRVRWIHAEGRGIRNKEGKVIRFDGINYDVTERREFQAELERLVEERTGRLKEMVGELEHFSYTITHDLKAPLRAMRGFAEVANQLCVKAEAKPLLERISQAAERMDLLIRDALNYSQAVRRELPLEDVDTAALLRGILDSYPQFQSLRAHIRAEGHLPLVLANEAGLTQCFSNLLGNAVKFVKPGQTPEIRVWSEVPPKRTEWVRIWIEDKGVGIAREMLPRVFDMFSRASKEHEGTGIGLALVRKVVQRMGGRVGVESEEGKGSRFWMELKLGRMAQPAKQQASAATIEHKPGTVLYVEDEENDAIFMGRAFRASGMETALRVVSDGRAAIEYLSGAGKYADRKSYPVPSAVLLDLNLPIVSGFGVLEWMRNHPDFARTPVIVFSSSTLEEDRVKADQLGANQFLAKPSSCLDFRLVVEELRSKWMC